jgi:hypothetical protein
VVTKATPAIRRGRRGERGAAVFVVVMAITLLTAVGLFAAHSATLVDQASGYSRLARQTQYMAEYGVLMGVTEAGSGSADAFIKEIEGATEACRANDGVSGEKFCSIRTRDEFNTLTQANAGLDLIEATASDGTPGSFGRNAATFGTVQVEFSDLGPLRRLVQGTNRGFKRVTATSYGEIHSSGNTCTDQVSSTVGRVTMRAHLIIGPVKDENE